LYRHSTRRPKTLDAQTPYRQRGLSWPLSDPPLR
jgi:hypothetical protein